MRALTHTQNNHANSNARRQFHSRDTIAVPPRTILARIPTSKQALAAMASRAAKRERRLALLKETVSADLLSTHRQTPEIKMDMGWCAEFCAC